MAQPGESFASAFFRGIETGQADDDLNGLISVREAYNHAFRTVQNDGAAQTPQMRAAGIGDLILARAPDHAIAGGRAALET